MERLPGRTDRESAIPGEDQVILRVDRRVCLSSSVSASSSVFTPETFSVFSLPSASVTVSFFPSTAQTA